MSYVSSYHHCVFSTKERRPLITPALRERLWPFLGGIARQNKFKALEIGGVENHVEHHQKKTFQEEFLELLQKHRVAYEERYLWD